MIRFVYIKFELGVIELTYTPDLHPTVGTLTNPGVLCFPLVSSQVRKGRTWKSSGQVHKLRRLLAAVPFVS